MPWHVTLLASVTSPQQYRGPTYSLNVLNLYTVNIMGLIFDLGTPVNTALFLYILYSVQRLIFPSTSVLKTVPNEFKAGYSWMPKAHPPTVLFKTYTPISLEPFDGKNGGRILLGINGIVFDVTAGRNFYGPSEQWLSSTVPMPDRAFRRHVWEFCRTWCFSRNGKAVIWHWYVLLLCCHAQQLADTSYRNVDTNRPTTG